LGERLLLLLLLLLRGGEETGCIYKKLDINRKNKK
jgi:hypothetical protein